MKKYIITIFFLLYFLCDSRAQECYKLQRNFQSYEDAISLIQDTKFKLQEGFEASKGSWIQSAQYYSCDGLYGYLIYSADRKQYILKNVPFFVWQEFKKAPSFDFYYNVNLKNSYELDLNKPRYSVNLRSPK